MDIIDITLARQQAVSELTETKAVNKITWDGDITGREVVYEGTSKTRGFCYVSGLLPKMGNFVGGTLVALSESGESISYAFDEIVDLVYDTEQALQISMFAVVAYKSNVETPGLHAVFPKPGIWLAFNVLDSGYTVTAVEFGTPMTTKIVKPDLIRPTVIDLDAHGIDIQSLTLTGGGVAEVDASALFGSITREGNYLFRGSFAGTTLDLPASFYQYDAAGNLVMIGLKLAGLVSGVVQVDVLLERTSLSVVVTPLGM